MQYVVYPIIFCYRQCLRIFLTWGIVFLCFGHVQWKCDVLMNSVYRCITLSVWTDITRFCWPSCISSCHVKTLQLVESIQSHETSTRHIKQCKWVTEREWKRKLTKLLFDFCIKLLHCSEGKMTQNHQKVESFTLINPFFVSKIIKQNKLLYLCGPYQWSFYNFQ